MELGAICFLYLEFTDLEGRKKRRMVVENLESTKGARNTHTDGFVLIGNPCWGYYLESKWSVEHGLTLEGLPLFDSFFDCSNHIECVFRQVIVVPVNDSLEALDSVLELHIFPRGSGKLLCNKEGL